MGLQDNVFLKLMGGRLGVYNKNINQSDDTPNGVQMQDVRLSQMGGSYQQDRMIRGKYQTLCRTLDNSYQAAKVINENSKDKIPVKALINPNKLKMDYDDKIISIGFEHGFKCGDIFEWCNTNTHWIIYLQDLTELAYFRGDIRKCSYQITWKNALGDKKSTYVAVRGPVETKINTIQKHSIIVDNPNYSLHMLVPKNKDTLEYFKRYSKFYINDGEQINPTCWRIEAIDTISTPGIIEINAVEYYSNSMEDDIKQGIAGGLITEPENPNQGDTINIVGETFVKPKWKNTYYIDNPLPAGKWYCSDKKVPVEIIILEDSKNKTSVSVKWTSSYSGQFDLCYGDQEGPFPGCKKTIVVESLF